MKRPAIILGGGGHAQVLADLLVQQGTALLGYTAPTRSARLRELAWLGDDSALARHAPDEVWLVNGLGSVADTAPRRRLFEQARAQGFEFLGLQHPSVILAGGTRLGQGCQLLPGALLNTGARLGDDVLINSRAVVEHDCHIGSHSHVASGAVVCGECEIGEGCHIGAGAVLIQGIQVGDGAIIAAGAVVTHNVKPMTLVAGVPAEVKRKWTG